VYNDFNPDSDEYEEQEVSVTTSDVKFKIKNNKGKLKIILESAYVDFEIDDDDQSERFMDKDWETETIIPTLKLTDTIKKEEHITYDGGHLFTLEVVY
jgi:ribosomal protein L6P/L9E